MKILNILKFLNHKIRFPNHNISIHHSAKLFRGCNIKIVKSGKISIGENCFIHQSSMIMTYGGDITLGNNVSVNPYTILYGHGGLKIGNFVRIAAHTVIIPSNHNFERTDIPIFRQGHTSKGITIEDDVWIGTHVTILDGVKIGQGSIIGAGAVVNKDIPPYSIVVGNPGKVIRNRLD